MCRYVGLAKLEQNLSTYPNQKGKTSMGRVFIKKKEKEKYGRVNFLPAKNGST
jgi:hypothetical protein